MSSLKNKTLLSYCQDIRMVCNGYFNKYSLVQFNYIRIYKDGGVIYLCNNEDWLRDYMEKNHPLIGAFEQDKKLFSMKTILWSGLAKDDLIMTEARNLYGFYNGVTLIRKNDDSHEFFNFGSSIKDPAILNEIINNLDYFEKFVDYFREKSSSIISKVKVEKIHFSNFVSRDLLSNSQRETSKKFYLGKDYGFAYLTDRELDCLKWLVNGKSAYETSIILNCASRTVETHLENVKQKLHCSKQVMLGYLVAKLGIDNMWEKQDDQIFLTT